MPKLQSRTILILFVVASLLLVVILSGGGGTHTIDIIGSDSESSKQTENPNNINKNNHHAANKKRPASSARIDYSVHYYEGVRKPLPSDFYQHVVALPRSVLIERDRAEKQKLLAIEGDGTPHRRPSSPRDDIYDPEAAVLQHGAAGKNDHNFWRKKQAELAEKEGANNAAAATPAEPTPDPQQQQQEPLDNQFKKNFDPKRLKVLSEDSILFMPGYVIEPGLANKGVDRDLMLPGFGDNNNNDKKSSKDINSNITKLFDIDEFSRLLSRMYSWFYMYSSRIGAPQSISYVVTVCGNSEEILHPQTINQEFYKNNPSLLYEDENGKPLSYEEIAERRKKKNFNDCKYVPNQIASFRGGLGHVVIVVAGNSVGDRQWVQVFSEIETNFPGRITVFHRPKYDGKCASAWNWIARLVFDETTPKADRVLFTSPNFHSSADWVARFGQFQYTTGAYASRFFDPPSIWQNSFGIGLGRRRPKSHRSMITVPTDEPLPPRHCVCNALLVSKEGYFQSQSFGGATATAAASTDSSSSLSSTANGFREYQSNSCDAAEQDFFDRMGKYQDPIDDTKQANTFIAAHPRRRNDDEEHALEEERIRLEEEKKRAEITFAPRRVVQPYQGKGIGGAGGGVGRLLLNNRGYDPARDNSAEVEKSAQMSPKLKANSRLGRSYAKGVHVGVGKNGEHMLIHPGKGDYQKRRFLNDHLMNEIFPSTFDDFCTCD